MGSTYRFGPELHGHSVGCRRGLFEPERLQDSGTPSLFMLSAKFVVCNSQAISAKQWKKHKIPAEVTNILVELGRVLLPKGRRVEFFRTLNDAACIITRADFQSTELYNKTLIEFLHSHGKTLKYLNIDQCERTDRNTLAQALQTLVHVTDVRQLHRVVTCYEVDEADAEMTPLELKHSGRPFKWRKHYHNGQVHLYSSSKQREGADDCRYTVHSSYTCPVVSTDFDLCQVMGLFNDVGFATQFAHNQLVDMPAYANCGWFLREQLGTFFRQKRRSATFAQTYPLFSMRPPPPKRTSSSSEEWSSFGQDHFNSISSTDDDDTGDEYLEKRAKAAGLALNWYTMYSSENLFTPPNKRVYVFNDLHWRSKDQLPESTYVGLVEREAALSRVYHDHSSYTLEDRFSDRWYNSWLQLKSRQQTKIRLNKSAMKEQDGKRETFRFPKLRSGDMIRYAPVDGEDQLQHYMLISKLVQQGKTVSLIRRSRLPEQIHPKRRLDEDDDGNSADCPRHHHHSACKRRRSPHRRSRRIDKQRQHNRMRHQSLESCSRRNASPPRPLSPRPPSTGESSASSSSSSSSTSQQSVNRKTVNRAVARYQNIIYGYPSENDSDTDSDSEEEDCCSLPPSWLAKQMKERQSIDTDSDTREEIHQLANRSWSSLSRRPPTLRSKRCNNSRFAEMFKNRISLNGPSSSKGSAAPSDTAASSTQAKQTELLFGDQHSNHDESNDTSPPGTSSSTDNWFRHSWHSSRSSKHDTQSNNDADRQQQQQPPEQEMQQQQEQEQEPNNMEQAESSLPNVESKSLDIEQSSLSESSRKTSAQYDFPQAFLERIRNAVGINTIRRRNGEALLYDWVVNYIEVVIAFADSVASYGKSKDRQTLPGFVLFLSVLISHQMVKSDSAKMQNAIKQLKQALLQYEKHRETSRNKEMYNELDNIVTEEVNNLDSDDFEMLVDSCHGNNTVKESPECINARTEWLRQHTTQPNKSAALSQPGCSTASKSTTKSSSSNNTKQAFDRRSKLRVPVVYSIGLGGNDVNIQRRRRRRMTAAYSSDSGDSDRDDIVRYFNLSDDENNSSVSSSSPATDSFASLFPNTRNHRRNSWIRPSVFAAHSNVKPTDSNLPVNLKKILLRLNSRDKQPPGPAPSVLIAEPPTLQWERIKPIPSSATTDQLEQDARLDLQASKSSSGGSLLNNCASKKPSSHERRFQRFVKKLKAARVQQTIKQYPYQVYRVRLPRERKVRIYEIRTWQDSPLETLVIGAQQSNCQDNNELTEQQMAELLFNPQLRNLKNLVIHDWQTDLLQYISPHIEPSVAARIVHLDLSNCSLVATSNTWRLQLLPNLQELVLYNCPKIPDVLNDICKLKSLKMLDISTTHDTLTHQFDDGNRQLEKIVESLPNLIWLDISGTNLAGFRTDIIPGLKSRQNRPFEFLGLFYTSIEACARQNIPAINIAGDSYEKYILTACEVYMNRVDQLRKCLNDLFQLYRYENQVDHDLERSIKILVTALGRHSSDKMVQMAASATLFYIIKLERCKGLLGRRVKDILVTRLLDAMNTFKTDQTMLRNGCLNLIHFRIPNDVIQEYTRLTSILLYIVTNSEQEDFVQRLSIFLLNSLACQVDGEQKTIVGNLGAIEKMLQVIDARFKRDLCDEVMETAWSTMWNVTDETPINCERFLNHDGMSYFVKCMDKFHDSPELLRNMMGLLGNVSECEHLRSRLMKQEYIVRFIELLSSQSDGIEVSYNSAGILAHIASDGEIFWQHYLTEEESFRKMMSHMDQAISRWEINSKRNINYRSFEPILRLIRKENTHWEAQYWAIWALANLTRVHSSKYCLLLEKDGGVQTLMWYLNVKRDVKTYGELPSKVVRLVMVTLFQHHLYRIKSPHLEKMDQENEISFYKKFRAKEIISFLKAYNLFDKDIIRHLELSERTLRKIAAVENAHCGEMAADEAMSSLSSSS